MIDGATNTVVATLRAGAGDAGVAVNRTTGRVHVVGGFDTVTVIADTLDTLTPTPTPAP